MRAWLADTSVTGEQFLPFGKKSERCAEPTRAHISSGFRFSFIGCAHFDGAGLLFYTAMPTLLFSAPGDPLKAVWVLDDRRGSFVSQGFIESHLRSDPPRFIRLAPYPFEIRIPLDLQIIRNPVFDKQICQQVQSFQFVGPKRRQEQTGRATENADHGDDERTAA